ncbi:uncharacterized protein LOC128186808 [Crassostrea angulata]|uniref:uncharacterized protein LOC128186808 n=1 Tax=Magallana angulata TaxID=2784310 RepID=UPI0022B147BA|nr:uncharacterized protein LOC128186808 [Crassostrea angulata]
MLPNKSQSEDMYTMKMQREFKALNPLYFDPTSDDQVKMREHVRHKKMAKTIENLKKINTQNADVHDFLPSWATNEYFESLHGKKESEEAKTKVNIEEIKIYVGEIVVKARKRLLEEAAALKSMQVPQDSEPPKKDEINEILVDMEDRRKAMNAVYQQLLVSFDSEKRKLMMEKCEIMKAKQMMAAVHAELKTSFDSEKRKLMMEKCAKIKAEQMMAVHAELKKIVFLKGFGFEDEEDNCFIPRKLLFFKIDGFRNTPQNMETPFGDVDPPNTNTSEDSAVNHSIDCMTPSNQKKRSFGRRFLKFLGF